MFPTVCSVNFHRFPAASMSLPFALGTCIFPKGTTYVAFHLLAFRLDYGRCSREQRGGSSLQRGEHERLDEREEQGSRYTGGAL